MKSYKIQENLYLNEMLVDYQSETEGTVSVPQHQYIIIDRSGSMWGDLDLVLDTVVNYVDKLPEGSTVSLGYFSGYSEYSLSVPYELKKEKDGVVKTADSYRHSIGMTNFTEILEKIKSDCKGRNSSLFFFTDGCHNCGPFSKVLQTLEEMKSDINVAIFVGCGWINRENMNDMAKTMEGSFIQLNSFSEFEQALLNFKNCIEESVPGTYVDMPEDSFNICSVLGKSVINYEKDDNNQVFYKATNKTKQVIYYLSNKLQGELTEFTNKDQVSARTMIHSLIQNNKVPFALEILNKIGDKYFMRKLYNTFTSEEYAVVENEILKSIFDSRKRYKEGQVENYLPDDNAWCVLDCLDVITNDNKAKIHLNDKEFVYEAVSRKSEQTDGSKLEYPKDIQANANNLKYHENRLNVNLNVTYPAWVPLIPQEFKETNAINESLKDYGYKPKDKYVVSCIRNYNIVLDGKLQTKKLVLSGLSKETINKLGSNLTLRSDKKYVLDLSNLPIINKSYLGTTSAEYLAKKCWQSFLLSNEISVLKHLKNCKEYSTETCNADLNEFLANNYYIKNGMYQPPKTSVDSTDEYMSYEFNVAFKGYSKASASSVIRKIQAGDNITERERIVEFYYNKYKKSNLEDLQKALEEINKEYKKAQTEIQHLKFGIILINRGCMNEFKNRDDMSLTIDVSEYGMHVSQITTIFKIVQKAVKI